MARKFFWHLTHDPDWELDPSFHPMYAYGAGYPTADPGLFVTDRPIYWNPWMGPRAVYAVRISAPEEILPPPSTTHPEYFIRDLSRVIIHEFLPLQDAIQRGKAEERAGIPWWKQDYHGFGGVEDWWFACKEVWDDKKRDLVVKCRKRKGLDALMKEWKDAHPGFDDPDEYYESLRKR